MSTRVTHTPKEAAGILGVSVAFLYKEMGRGKLSSLAFGARRLRRRTPQQPGRSMKPTAGD